MDSKYHSFVLEKAELTLIFMLSKTKKVFTTPPTVLCSIAFTTQHGGLEHFHYYLCRQLKDGGMEIFMEKILSLYARGMSTRDIHDQIHFKVSQLLTGMGYSKQMNQKMLQVGEQSPDRDEQFGIINDLAKQYLEAGDPVISVDTKKKKNIGNFKNNGTEYRKTKDPRKVWDHDFPVAELGKVNPYGVYVLNSNTGFINLGTDHDMLLSSELDAPAPCRLNAPDLDFACRTSADCLHQHQQVI